MPRFFFVNCRLFLIEAVLAFLCVGDIVAQKADVDPDRIFTTDLHWGRLVGTPHSEKDRYADGTLVIFYLDGSYAEVTTSFTKTNGKTPVVLTLNDSSIVRLGTWSRTEDDVILRTVSREVDREKTLQIISCKTTIDQTCGSALKIGPLEPSRTNTCRLEHPSSTHIADAIVCAGLTVFHSQHAIDLNGFPSLIHRLIEAQEGGPKP